MHGPAGENELTGTREADRARFLFATQCGRGCRQPNKQKGSGLKSMRPDPFYVSLFMCPPTQQCKPENYSAVSPAGSPVSVTRYFFSMISSLSYPSSMNHQLKDNIHHGIDDRALGSIKWIEIFRPIFTEYGVNSLCQFPTRFAPRIRRRQVRNAEPVVLYHRIKGATDSYCLSVRTAKKRRLIMNRSLGLITAFAHQFGHSSVTRSFELSTSIDGYIESVCCQNIAPTIFNR